MAKMLSTVKFADADAVRQAARETGFPVLVGEKVRWSPEDRANRVAIYTDAPGEDHAPFFAAFRRILDASVKVETTAGAAAEVEARIEGVEPNPHDAYPEPWAAVLTLKRADGTFGHNVLCLVGDDLAEEMRSREGETVSVKATYGMWACDTQGLPLVDADVVFPTPAPMFG